MKTAAGFPHAARMSPLAIADVLRRVWDFVPLSDPTTGRLDHVCAAWRRAVHGHRLACRVAAYSDGLVDYIHAHAAAATGVSLTLDGMMKDWRSPCLVGELLFHVTAVRSMRLALRVRVPSFVNNAIIECVCRWLRRPSASELSAIELCLPANELNARVVRSLCESLPWARLERFEFETPRDCTPVIMIAALRHVRRVSLRTSVTYAPTSTPNGRCSFSRCSFGYICPTADADQAFT